MKPESYNAMSPSPGATNTISVSDREVHAFKRRIQNNVLSQSGLKAMESRVMQHLDDYVDYLGSSLDPDADASSAREGGWSYRRSMPEVSNFLTYNLVTDLCYDRHLDLFRSSKDRWVPHAVTVMSRMVVTVRSDMARLRLDCGSGC